MATIRLAGFGGENRALHPMLLPENIGVTSLNQKPNRGDLRPWKAPLTVATVPAGRKTIYRMGRDVVSDTEYWLSWTTVVHAVRGPNADDNDERTYFTGDGTPKWTDKSKALASLPYPTTARELGIPAPASPLTLSVLVVTTTAGAFVVGSVYLIATVGTTDFTLAGSENNTVGTSFTATAVGSGTGTVTSGNLLNETRYYTYTYVTDIGEEGAPNPAPTEIVCKTDANLSITNLAAAPSGNYGINRIRIYRTQSGTAGDANFFFVREIASTLTQTTDDGRILAEVLPSTTWLQPPSDLKNLIGLWNGMMAGISGRSVRFCEAFEPYAWPFAYEILPTAVTPVALATFGQTLVILTDGNPIAATGGSPDAMDEQPVEFTQACVSPESAVGMGYGVAWASPDGLAFIGDGGARLLTQNALTRDDWQAMNPSSIRGCMYEMQYFGFYEVDGVQKGFMIDPRAPNGMYFMDFGVDALYLDTLQDTLFVLNGVNIEKFDAGNQLTATFKSKLHRLPKPSVGFACAEVTADAYPVTFKLYADGQLKHTQQVTSTTAFRLPSGYYAQTVQIELQTTGAVQGAVIAHSMQELAQL
jgi:hypothetical protein